MLYLGVGRYIMCVHLSRMLYRYLFRLVAIVSRVVDLSATIIWGTRGSLFRLGSSKDRLSDRRRCLITLHLLCTKQ